MQTQEKPVFHGYEVEKISPSWYKLTAYYSDQRRVYFGYTPEHVKGKAGLLRVAH